MNCTRVLAVLLLSLWGAENAQAQPGESTPISALNQALSPPWRNLIVPDLPTADMRMSWNDFKELLVRIQLPPKEEAKPEEAPLPWTLSAAKYQADARVFAVRRQRAYAERERWADGGPGVSQRDAASLAGLLLARRRISAAEEALDGINGQGKRAINSARKK